MNGPEDILINLEDLCEKNKPPSILIDRHTAAFLAVRDPKSIESFLFDLATSAEHSKILAQLKCFARLQMLHKLPSVPNLCLNFMSILDPVLERYHGHDTRDKIKKKLQTHATAGSLIKMVNVLDSPEVRKKDLKDFKLALREYDYLTKEANWLDERLQNEHVFGRPTAQKFAAFISCIVAMLSVLLIFFISITDNPVF